MMKPALLNILQLAAAFAGAVKIFHAKGPTKKQKKFIDTGHLLPVDSK